MTYTNHNTAHVRIFRNNIRSICSDYNLKINRQLLLLLLFYYLIGHEAHIEQK